jgi:hypothetical protein
MQPGNMAAAISMQAPSGPQSSDPPAELTCLAPKLREDSKFEYVGEEDDEEEKKETEKNNTNQRRKRRKTKKDSEEEKKEEEKDNRPKEALSRGALQGRIRCKVQPQQFRFSDRQKPVVLACAEQGEDFKIEDSNCPLPPNDACPICISNFAEESVVHCQHCRYSYHKECMNKYRNKPCLFIRNKPCPTCKALGDDFPAGFGHRDSPLTVAHFQQKIADALAKAGLAPRLHFPDGQLLLHTSSLGDNDVTSQLGCSEGYRRAEIQGEEIEGNQPVQVVPFVRPLVLLRLEVSDSNYRNARVEMIDSIPIEIVRDDLVPSIQTLMSTINKDSNLDWVFMGNRKVQKVFMDKLKDASRILELPKGNMEQSGMRRKKLQKLKPQLQDVALKTLTKKFKLSNAYLSSLLSKSPTDRKKLIKGDRDVESEIETLSGQIQQLTKERWNLTLKKDNVRQLIEEKGFHEYVVKQGLHGFVDQLGAKDHRYSDTEKVQEIKKIVDARIDSGYEDDVKHISSALTLAEALEQMGQNKSTRDKLEQDRNNMVAKLDEHKTKLDGHDSRVAERLKRDLNDVKYHSCKEGCFGQSCADKYLTWLELALKKCQKMLELWAEISTRKRPRREVDAELEKLTPTLTGCDLDALRETLQNRRIYGCGDRVNEMLAAVRHDDTYQEFLWGNTGDGHVSIDFELSTWVEGSEPGNNRYRDRRVTCSRNPTNDHQTQGSKTSNWKLTALERFPPYNQVYNGTYRIANTVNGDVLIFKWVTDFHADDASDQDDFQSVTFLEPWLLRKEKKLVSSASATELGMLLSQLKSHISKDPGFHAKTWEHAKNVLAKQESAVHAPEKSAGDIQT